MCQGLLGKRGGHTLNTERNEMEWYTIDPLALIYEIQTLEEKKSSLRGSLYL
jgi:hypothetical protein